MAQLSGKQRVRTCAKYNSGPRRRRRGRLKCLLLSLSLSRPRRLTILSRQGSPSRAHPPSSFHESRGWRRATATAREEIFPRAVAPGLPFLIKTPSAGPAPAGEICLQFRCDVTKSTACSAAAQSNDGRRRASRNSATTTARDYSEDKYARGSGRRGDRGDLPRQMYSSLNASPFKLP